MTYAVVGATSWGITLAWLLGERGHRVVVVARDLAEAHAVREQRGLARLPQVVLDLDKVAVAVPRELPKRLEGVVAAVPAQSLRQSFAEVAYPRDVPVLSAAKGIELNSGRRMSEVLGECGWPERRVAVLSGPNLAVEIGEGRPAASVVAARDEGQARRWQEALSGPAFRVYRSADVVGVEVAGAVKNVIAIAAGAAFGRDYGVNTVAAILTRGLAETARLGVALGGQTETFQGLAGVGDLAATCFSPLSRNRRLGELLARGASPAEAEAKAGGVAEGAATAPVALAIARRLGVEVPITEQVTAVLAGERTVDAAMASLFGRAARPE